jgi:hypothetical protein
MERTPGRILKVQTLRSLASTLQDSASPGTRPDGLSALDRSHITSWS